MAVVVRVAVRRVFPELGQHHGVDDKNRSRQRAAATDIPVSQTATQAAKPAATKAQSQFDARAPSDGSA